MKKILLVEDDHDIVNLLSIHLNDLGHSLTREFDGWEGLKKALHNVYDLIILDLMLPGMDGMEICRQIRAEKITTPILMLTARSEEIDKVLGLESGADDYLTKPFSIREFIARVKAIFRREQQLRFGDLMVDGESRKVTILDNRVELTPKEFDLLFLLASHPGRSYSRDKLLSQVWGYDFNGYEHTVNSHINRLRSKIESDLSQPQYILTTWGVGYRFNDEIH
ncbi:UNVERIFIED_CONTAM: hypothetical protein GTU68_032111 [Idotea baltica]|nr:hypothetical protein [Idotea baltica]